MPKSALETVNPGPLSLRANALRREETEPPWPWQTELLVTALVGGIQRGLMRLRIRDFEEQLMIDLLELAHRGPPARNQFSLVIQGDR